MDSLAATSEDAFIDESMDDVSQEKHKQLLQTITSKTKRKIQPTTRNEPSLQVSEFHLSCSQQTNIDELTNALNKKAPKLKQKIQTAKASKKLLQKPLDKVHAEKIKRAVAYDNFKKHISRWSAVVEKNKAADQLIFPLKSNEVEVFDNRMVDFTKGNIQPTDLQKKISIVLQSSKVFPQKQNDLKKSWMEKEKEKYPLTIKELFEKRKSMAKFRAQESYRHAKAHRQNKIKSKKYHRLLRKEKTKEQLKEFEKLQETDPVAALEKLNAIEKARAEERASLRHKSTGQWARNHSVRAKYDKNSRIALSEQLNKGKELTQKVGSLLNDNDSSDDSDMELVEISEQAIDPDNPWLSEQKKFSDFLTSYNNFVQNTNKSSINNGHNEESKYIEEKNENPKLNKDINNEINETKSTNKIYKGNNEKTKLDENIINEGKENSNKKTKLDEKKLTQKVKSSMYDIDNSDDSEEEQVRIPIQIVDKNNSFPEEQKKNADFVKRHMKIFGNNSKSSVINSQNEESQYIKEKNENPKLNKSKNNNINEITNKNKKKKENNEKIEFNDNIINESKKIKQKTNKNKTKSKAKVKYLTVEELSDFSGTDSGVEVIKIVNSKKKKLSETKTKNNNIDSIISNNNTSKVTDNAEVIQLISGTWLVSSENVNGEKSKKKKVHKDVENIFKTVETKLKHKIINKFEKINKMKTIQPTESDLAKQKQQEVDSDYFKMNNKRKKAEFNEPLYENNKVLDNNEHNNENNFEDNQGTNFKIEEKCKKPIQNIDPTEFLQVAQTSLETEGMAMVEDHLDDKEENDQEKLIAEAFADDDIINEFKEEKRKLEEQSKPKVETALPGWGCWTGPNIKKRTFRKRTNMGMFRTPAKPPRKDFNREKVIINENADDAIKSHLVSELPYPFKNIEEYEETVKVPVGRTWVPETVFHKLTASPVVTQMGQIIDPINENSVVKQLELND